jgi:hypothetical protein
MHFGFVDGVNLLYVDDEDAGTVGGDEFKIYGGHRLWHAPEVGPRTHQPENEVIDVTEHQRGVTLSGTADERTGVRKDIDISLAGDEPVVTVTHTLHNEGLWPIETAPWEITQLDAGAKGVLPIAEREPGLVPDRSVALWPYTDVADDRIVRSSDAIWVDHDADGDGKLKIGASGGDMWIGGVSHEVLFHKSISYDEDATYPDRGSTIEIYTDENFLEIETLAPFSTVQPGDSLEHTVEWTLIDGVDTTDRAVLLEAFKNQN